MTVVAEDDTGLGGFAHVVFDEDGRWGSLVGDVHVVQHRRRTGLGAALLSRAAQVVVERATGDAMYLWVLEQNTAAQKFYRALGGTCVEEAPVSPPVAYHPGSPAHPPCSASPGPTPRCSRRPADDEPHGRPGGTRHDR
ncbi:GNAT family N-acetyltransferase [Streptomyces sp. NBC_00057]|uniref:GNAT family N-acetyltransferase n=1 Tax=Streptomyces sp. NBC_00057 TaxID=2975634 RepID=UPI0032518626